MRIITPLPVGDSNSKALCVHIKEIKELVTHQMQLELNQQKQYAPAAKSNLTPFYKI